MNDAQRPLSRRQWIQRGFQSLAGLAFVSELEHLIASETKRFFKISACDWSLGKRCEISALELARKIGLDGVQVSLGRGADDMRLRKAKVRDRYREAAKAQKVAISSLGILELNRVPYKSAAEAEVWVGDSIDAAKDFDVRVVLLPFFSRGELKGDPKGIDEVVRRLERIAPLAEKAGVILGIESYLDAAEHMDIIQRVGSPSVQVYYDVVNSLRKGYDVYTEIRQLGREHICEFHMKEYGSLLGQGQVDFKKVRAAIDDIGYNGWLVIEGAQPRGKPLLESYVANRKFLRSLFPEGRGAPLAE